MSLKEGDIAPNFTLKDDNENSFSLSDYKGKKVVLYFYPKDNTSRITSYNVCYTKLLRMSPSFKLILISSIYKII